MLQINKASWIISIVFFIMILLVDSSFLFAQSFTKSNLDIIYNLIDSSAYRINKNFSSSKKNIFLNTILPDEYSILRNKINAAFEKAGGSIALKDSVNRITVQYAISNAQVNYSDIFRDGFLGSYKINRNVATNIDYSIFQNGQLLNSDSDKFVNNDTVNYDELKDLESPYPFTKGKIPSEPFFSSLLEPLLAISAAAITVYLFFSIRSK